MITGSTAAGEAIPPHFQFQTSAKTTDGMKLRLDMVDYMKTVEGQFGHKAPAKFDCTHGMNGKGGMDDDEFEKFMLNSMLPLWPNARDVPGKRVMFKADSGPGRTNPTLLAKLRCQGFILYHGVIMTHNCDV